MYGTATNTVAYYAQEAPYCPHCGKCKHCGQPATPPYQVYPMMPYYQGPYWQYTIPNSPYTIT